MSSDVLFIYTNFQKPSFKILDLPLYMTIYFRLITELHEYILVTVKAFDQFAYTGWSIVILTGVA